MWPSVADFIADRGDTVLIALRVPKDLWDRYEYKHQHYGKAISQLKYVVCDLLAAHSISTLMSQPYVDRGDPFYRDHE